MKRLWKYLKSLFDDRSVLCDVCGERAYLLKWGGRMHISKYGTVSVHAIDYIRHTDWSKYRGVLKA